MRAFIYQNNKRNKNAAVQSLSRSGWHNNLFLDVEYTFIESDYSPIRFCIRSRLILPGRPTSQFDSSTSLVRICMSSVFLSTSWLSCVSFSCAAFKSVSNDATVFSSLLFVCNSSLPILAVSSKSFSFCKTTKKKKRYLNTWLFKVIDKLGRIFLSGKEFAGEFRCSPPQEA